MAHVQLAGWVRQHRAGVVFTLRETRVVLDGFVGVDRLPVRLGGLFNFGWTIFILHDVLRKKFLEVESG